MSSEQMKENMWGRKDADILQMLWDITNSKGLGIYLMLD